MGQLVIKNREGKVIRRSKNLRPILNHHLFNHTATEYNWVRAIRLEHSNHRLNYEGQMIIHWKNGDNCVVQFASYDVMVEFYKKHRVLRPTVF